ncbi:MAG: ion transporter [Bacillota bacterium]
MNKSNYWLWFDRFFMVLILINVVVVCLQTFPAVTRVIGVELDYADYAILILFSVEITIRIIVNRTRYFKSGWNWFDMIVVFSGYFSYGNLLAVFRVFRLLRILKIFSNVPSLRQVVEAMFVAVSGLKWIFVMAFFVCYTYAVIGVHLYGKDFPVYFGDLGKGMYSMFELLTLAGWGSLTRIIAAKHLSSYAFFISYITFASYIILNLIVGTIVNSIKSAHDEKKADAGSGRQTDSSLSIDTILLEITALRDDIAKFNERSQHNG